MMKDCKQGVKQADDYEYEYELVVLLGELFQLVEKLH